MSLTPLEGPNAGWINNALENAMEEHGAPKHIIPDQVSVFAGDVFAELLDSSNIKPRLGAVGKHGSISVTERVIKTLKYEWLRRVPIIKGFDHLTMLCEEFECWYNSWCPNITLDGIRPGDVYYDKKPEKPKRDSKKVPCNIEYRLFRETKVTGYRLKKSCIVCNLFFSSFLIGLTEVKSVNTSKLKATFLHFDGVWHLPVLLFNKICWRIDFSKCNH